MRFTTAGALLVLGTTILSCSTFPTAHLSLDLSRESIPVMLSAAPTDTPRKTLAFEAGYQFQTASTSRTSGGVTTTLTSSMSMFRNQPLGAQLRNTLIQTPTDLQVTGLTFRNSFTMLFLVGSMETTDYSTQLEIGLPTGGSK